MRQLHGKIGEHSGMWPLVRKTFNPGIVMFKDCVSILEIVMMDVVNETFPSKLSS